MKNVRCFPLCIIYMTMPFLKLQKTTWSQQRIKSSKRNGLRHTVYMPEAKRFAKTRYIGEWRYDKREGKGIGISRCHEENTSQTVCQLVEYAPAVCRLKPGTPCILLCMKSSIIVGISSNSHGWMYEGDWCNDQRHGYGILSKISRDGEIRKVYAGDWVNGKKHGFGSNWYEDDSYYEGRFRSNKRDGYGQIWYTCDGYYQGTWVNDRYHGEGMLVQGNGNIYEGQFANGRKEGGGVFYHLDTRRVQEGSWKNDVCTNSTTEDIGGRRSALHPPSLHIPRINGQALLLH
ncbi:MORN repeat-containing protein 3 [Ooceraea biroi]|nr:MORN repeat-containing protein 3 [Ooceraea biroi]